MIHIEGMGILGSLLAIKLTRIGVKFTWNDIDTPINAWQACTGCIYPSGDAFDMENYNHWRYGYFGRPPELEIATYCFLSKHPPHGGKYEQQRVGSFGVAELPSLHLNAQQLVPRIRHLFLEEKRPQAAQGAIVIVAHGFSQRLQRYLWGWTSKVRLESPNLPTLWGKRHSYYLRVGRYQLAYAYPIPLEPGWWYAGSSFVNQYTPKFLTTTNAKFWQWKNYVNKYDITVLEHGSFIQGWRPVAAPEDKLLLRKMEGRWVVKPLWNSGVRHAPAMVQAIMEKL